MGYQILCAIGINKGDGSGLVDFILGDHITDIPDIISTHPDAIILIKDFSSVIGPPGPQGEPGPEGSVEKSWSIGSIFFTLKETDPVKILGFGGWGLLEKIGDTPLYAWERVK